MKLAMQSVTAPDGRTVHVAGCVFGLVVVAMGCSIRNHDPGSESARVDAVLGFGLHRALVDPGNLPDLNLVIKSPEIVVRSEISNSVFRIGEAALPTVPGKRLLLLSTQEIDARAARSGDVYFVAVDDFKLAGDEAEFYIGVDVLTSPSRPMLCCCTNKVRYTRMNGVWVYRESTEFRCS